MHSKMRQNQRGKAAQVSIGYGTPRVLRGILSSGLRPITISTIAQLKALDLRIYLPVLSATLGQKKKLELLREARKINIKQLGHIKDTDAEIKEIEAAIIRRKDEKKKKAAEKDKKKKEKGKKVEEKKKKEEKKLEEKVETKKEEEKKEKLEEKHVEEVKQTIPYTPEVKKELEKADEKLAKMIEKEQKEEIKTESKEVKEVVKKRGRPKKTAEIAK